MVNNLKPFWHKSELGCFCLILAHWFMNRNSFLFNYFKFYLFFFNFFKSKKIFKNCLIYNLEFYLLCFMYPIVILEKLFKIFFLNHKFKNFKVFMIWKRYLVKFKSNLLNTIITSFYHYSPSIKYSTLRQGSRNLRVFQ